MMRRNSGPRAPTAFKISLTKSRKAHSHRGQGEHKRRSARVRPDQTALPERVRPRARVAVRQFAERGLGAPSATTQQGLRCRWRFGSGRSEIRLSLFCDTRSCLLPRDFHELPASSGVLHAGASKAIMRSPAALLLLLCATCCCSALVVVPARSVVHAVAARENACRTEPPKAIIGHDPKS